MDAISDPHIAALTGWKFGTVRDLDSDVLLSCGSQIQFIKDFREKWRPGITSAKLQVSEDWRVIALPVVQVPLQILIPPSITAPRMET